VVSIGTRDIKYMISFALPASAVSRSTGRGKNGFTRARSVAAKLDTVVHELITRSAARRIRRIEKKTARTGQLPRYPVLRAGRGHGARVSGEQAVAGSTTSCGTTSPRSNANHGGVVGTSFRTFPSFPQRYIGASRAAAVRATPPP